MLVSAIVILLFVHYGTADRKEKITVPMPPDPMTRQEILNDLYDLSDNRLPVEPVLGGKFFTTRVYFPDGFSGEAGSRFWAGIEDGHMAYVLQYTVEEEPDRSLVCKVTGINEGNKWPTGKGLVYERGKDGFVKAQ